MKDKLIISFLLFSIIIHLLLGVFVFPIVMLLSAPYFAILLLIIADNINSQVGSTEKEAK